MYDLILKSHSVLRYAVILCGIWAIATSLKGLFKNLNYTENANKSGLFFLISCHLQLVLGIILYVFLSPTTAEVFKDFGASMKDAVLRFWGMEHFVGMLIAIILITIGRILSKKGTDHARYKKALIFYGIGMLIILAMIPWPWSDVARAL